MKEREIFDRLWSGETMKFDDVYGNLDSKNAFRHHVDVLTEMGMLVVNGGMIKRDNNNGDGYVNKDKL